ncbi:ATP-dependent DNA helicase [Desulfogranum japonicum]|uniref:ATP-dependent DNA helicase n=1 Tax=Desulfogranum japonicum TaxID=231447 RepID=UPI0004135878|nr:ATP-dependent DNA helicase [Desulfogranum japonicum]
MNEYFGPQGILAKNLKHHEPRPGQQEMADAVASLLTHIPNQYDSTDQAECLVIEAETGLGKTLAYLVPAACSGKKIIISTNTRNLQDQILEREIPFIQKHIQPGLRAMSVKGRQNYLCLHRWHQELSSHQGRIIEDDDIRQIEEWVEETEYGERTEIAWLPSSAPLWQRICCQSHTCLGADCPDTASCFLTRLRKDAANCSILIVNHHLLCSDLAVRKSGYGEVLPRYEGVIFDEAHHLEQVATTFFGHTFSRYQVADLVHDIERSADTELGTDKRKKVFSHTTRCIRAMDAFSLLFPNERGRFPLDPDFLTRKAVREATQSIQTNLDKLTQCLEALPKGDAPWEHYGQRSIELNARLEQITAIPTPEEENTPSYYTYWYDRTEKNLSLHATPVDISHELQSTLFASVQSCVFTSATLTTGGNFSYFLGRLGLPADTTTLSFPSPFDYANRTRLYVPNKPFPEPTAQGYSDAVHQQLEKLVTLADGRALLLFTSFKAMETAYQFLKNRLPYPLHMQGEAPRKVLLQRFTTDIHSVLFAVSSFWEGVDIPGESLSLLVMDKLPFEVPSDPVIMARVNRIKANGGNPFFDFQVPRAILSLRQGAGRLMRTAQDRGVIAILDIRLFTKGYGRRFLKSLPPSPLVREYRLVADFFQKEYEQEY